KIDASKRLGKILTGEHHLPQARLGGGSAGVIHHRGIATPWPGLVGLHPQTLPARPPEGMAAVKTTPTNTNVLSLGFTFGPSQRYRSPPVLRPLLTSPKRARTSTRTVPHHPANHKDEASETPMET